MNDIDNTDDERDAARSIRLSCLDLVIGLHKTGAATGIKSIDIILVADQLAEFVLFGKKDE